MKTWTIAAASFCLACNLAFAQDVYPELKTLDGKTYLQVKVVKVSPAELRVMHSDGFATLPLSILPPEVRARYGEVDAAAEAAQAEQRRQGNAAASMKQRQEKEAMQLADITKRPYEMLRDAIMMRDWCLANPKGGVLNGETCDNATRDFYLGEAMKIIDARPLAVAEAAPAAPPAMPQTEGNAETSPSATSSAPQPPSFTPGVIELISARYTLTGNMPRNVKNRLQRLLPTGEITRPISILVTDDLSDAAKNQGNAVVGTGVAVSQTVGDVTATVAVVETQEVNRNMLTVEYVFNGQKFKKQAVEGGYLVLP